MAKKNLFIGVRDLHIFPITDETSKLTYGTPIKIEGLKKVSLSVDSGDNNSIYADDTEYYTSLSNSTYTITIDLLNLPDELEKAFYGKTKDSKNVFVDGVDNQAGKFALAFQLTKDKNSRRVVFYNCMAKPYNMDITTKENNQIKEQPISIEIIANVDPFTNKTKATTTEDTDTTTYNNWFTAVYTGAEN